MTIKTTDFLSSAKINNFLSEIPEAQTEFFRFESFSNDLYKFSAEIKQESNQEPVTVTVYSAGDEIHRDKFGLRENFSDLNPVRITVNRDDTTILSVQ